MFYTSETDKLFVCLAGVFVMKVCEIRKIRHEKGSVQFAYPFFLL